MKNGRWGWTRWVGVALAAMLALPSQAHEKPMNLDELMGAFGWDFEAAQIRTEQVASNLYVLFGIGGNIAVSVGPQGVLLVDDQFPQMVSKVGAAISEVGGGGVDFVINTHWHFDHADGNLALGPGGAWMVSQANSRDMMLDDHVINLVTLAYEQKAYPKSALPVITYDDTMQFHFNNERIDLLHAGPAHTTGDTAVIFRGSNAVHLGDVFNMSGYPFIDVDNGGDLRGVINFCQAVLDTIDADTKVIPGHGEISDAAGLKAYIDMLEDLHGTIAKLVKRGRSLEEVVAANPTAAYDAAQGDSTNFVDRAYHSIKRELGR